MREEEERAMVRGEGEEASGKLELTDCKKLRGSWRRDGRQPALGDDTPQPEAGPSRRLADGTSNKMGACRVSSMVLVARALPDPMQHGFSGAMAPRANRVIDPFD